MSLYEDGGNVPSPTEFAKWRSRWFDQAKYKGREMCRMWTTRINTLLELSARASAWELAAHQWTLSVAGPTVPAWRCQRPAQG